MPIAAANLLYYLSGGAANTDPAASLGGDISATVVGTTLSSLFPDVTGDQATSGYTSYRCVYLKNTDANAYGLMSPVFWVVIPTNNAQDAIAIGIDPAGKNSVATTIGSETTAPAGVTFSAPSSKATGLSLPGTPYLQNDYIALWIQRTVAAGASPVPVDSVYLRVEGDTL